MSCLSGIFDNPDTSECITLGRLFARDKILITAECDEALIVATAENTPERILPHINNCGVAVEKFEWCVFVTAARRLKWATYSSHPSTGHKPPSPTDRWENHFSDRHISLIRQIAWAAGVMTE